MDLRQLRYFVAVGEELHFSRASARLNLAQSALSSQIRQLEAEVGGPLFVRSTRRVELTPAGEALLTDAREILAAADGALTRCRALARGETGELVIGSLGPAPGGVLAPVLARFSGRHPNVRVEIRALDFTEVVSALREHRVVFLDVGLSDAVKRVGLGVGRPLLLGNVRGRIKALLDERRPVYEEVATFVVRTDDRSADQVADEVAARVEEDLLEKEEDRG